MDAILVAALSFLTVGGIILAIWWVLGGEGAIRARLASLQPGQSISAPMILRAEMAERLSSKLWLRTGQSWLRRLETLTEQAGFGSRSAEALGSILVSGGISGILGAWRMGDWLWGVPWAVAGGAIPIVYLLFRRRKRLDDFSEQFPEALDMITRSLRAGYALGPALQMLAEEMPEPVGSEFKRVSEEILLGRPANDAMLGLYQRMHTEEVRFFYVAVSIQREVGGNLAEIFDNLSEVIRERFKLLAFARALSVQQRATAYCVGASPFVAGILISLIIPGWFDPLWKMHYARFLVFGAILWELIGFYFLKRVATITV
jgi:tight adherence protein B